MMQIRSGAYPQKSATQRLLGAVMLCLLALIGTMPMAGCNGESVAQDIVNWTPALQSAVAAVDSTISIFAPQDAAALTVATAGFNAGSELLIAQAKTYLANPNATVLALLQAQVVAFQQNVNTSLLAAARITNTQSQQQALIAIQAVASIVSAILALVVSVSSPAAKAQMRQAVRVKISDVRPYLDKDRTAELVATHYDIPMPAAAARVRIAEFELAQAGF